jgi:hypothetical protein
VRPAARRSRASAPAPAESETRKLVSSGSRPPPSAKVICRGQGMSAGRAGGGGGGGWTPESVAEVAGMIASRVSRSSMVGSGSG